MNICKRKRKKVERKSNHTVFSSQTQRKHPLIPLLKESFLLFLFEILYRLDCYKEAMRERDGESRFPLDAQSDTRSLKTSGGKCFDENKHLLTYLLTRQLLFLLIINLVKVFRSQSKSNFPSARVDLGERSHSMSVIVLTLKGERERERKREIIAFFFSLSIGKAKGKREKWKEQNQNRSFQFSQYYILD